MNLFGEAEAPQEAYTVLARKYRPKTLDELIGQEALVRTLRNAVASGKIAHAFLLTGIRGVGKTSTARIIARVLNNIAADQQVDGNIDVMEMDAASNTGVDNIREIIEAAKYKPISAPYKIFIIDEVHMLSKGAFNALLKTLEEPPPHVIFLFCTTEIRKVPVTILSRCQRFDLRRVDSEVLVAHLAGISQKEGIEIEEAALKMIAAASEGSVRDSLSLLDQSNTFSEGKITAKLVRNMLGYADRTQVMNLFEQLMGGQLSQALQTFADVCKTSAEPEQVIRDLLEFSHLVTRLKITPDLQPETIPEGELAKAKELSTKLSMMALSFVWQMLVKALSEIKYAPNPKHAAEMALIRVSHSTEIPDPTKFKPNPIATTNTQSAPYAPAQPSFVNSPETFQEMAELFRSRKELILYSQLRQDVHLVGFKPEQITLRLKPTLPADFTNKLSANLNSWTGKRWMVIVSGEAGEPTLEEQGIKAYQELVQEAAQDPLVKAVIETFPGADIAHVIKRTNIKKEEAYGH